MDSTSTTPKTHDIFLSMLVLTFDSYILIQIPSLMFKKPINIIENHQHNRTSIFDFNINLKSQSNSSIPVTHEENKVMKKYNFYVTKTES